MNSEERWSYINNLDDTFLRGGVILSEWCSFIVRESDNAFCNSNDLATILLAISAIETCLRAEYTDSEATLYALIGGSIIENNLKKELHNLRQYRNTWVHVKNPWDDAKILEYPETYEESLRIMAKLAVKLLRVIIYKDQFI